jgi:hypothetical protein
MEWEGLLMAQSVAGRSSAFGELRMWDEHHSLKTAREREKRLLKG